MNNEDTSDRRMYRRLSLEAVMGVEIWGADAAAVDVSAGGIRFHCAGLDVRVGHKLRVQLTLQDQSFYLIGRVIRVVKVDATTQEVALAFSDIDLDLERLIEGVLDADERDESELPSLLRVHLVGQGQAGS